MARPHPALISLAADRPLPHVADESHLLKSAIEHKMTGLLWRSVDNQTLNLNAETTRTLAALSLQIEARHARLWQTLADITSRLRSIEIDVATIKGVTAEERWYDRIGDRPCVDVDVLLGPSDLLRADDVVAELAPGHSLGGQVSDLVARNYLQALPLVVGGVHLDLHFDLLKLGYPSRQDRAVWDRTTMHTHEGRSEFRVLDPETALIHFLVHLNKDRFAYLLGHVDIARILTRENLDWSHIDHFLRDEGLDVIAYEALDAVIESLDLAPVPHRVSGGWRRRVWRGLWRPEVRLLGNEGTVRFRRRGHMVLPMLNRDRSGATMRGLLRRFAPPPSLLDFNHPDTTGPYLVRIFKDRIADVRLRQARRKGRAGQ